MATAKPAQKKGAGGKRASVDWEGIESAYRAGVLSIREIAKLHGITDKAIRNKAKAVREAAPAHG